MCVSSDMHLNVSVSIRKYTTLALVPLLNINVDAFEPQRGSYNVGRLTVDYRISSAHHTIYT